MEDDALPSTNFIHLLDTFVVRPWQAGKIRASSVTLYSYHSHSWSKHRLDNQEYVYGGKYEEERSFRTEAEYRLHGRKKFPPHFRVRRSGIEWGAVANMFTLNMAVKLRDYLLQVKNEETPIDVLISRDFSRFVGQPRQQVEPSLVNHIGFYSERRDQVSFVNSDVRFQIDPAVEG